MLLGPGTPHDTSLGELTAEHFADGTGWTIKPEGACRGEVCVPLGGGDFDASMATSRLGMSVVTDADSGITAIGPESLGDRALASAEAPELVLADLGGEEFRLSSLRGRKVVIVSWAPY